MQIRAWISALRLRTLPLAVSGISSGAAVSAYLGYNKVGITLLCLATAAALQILSNLANDYGDFSRGTDNNQRVGPERALQSGRIRPADMLRAIWIVGMVSALLALSVIALAFPTDQWLEAILFIGLGAAALWAAINYTMGKNPYGYSGLGDVFVGLFFGFLAVVGTAWLQSLDFQVLALAPALGMAGYSMGVLHMNNMRDQVGDAASGKITLAVRMGMANGKIYHCFLIAFGLLAWWSLVWIEGLAFSKALICLSPGTALSLFQLMGVARAKAHTSFDTWLKVMVLACVCMALGFTALMVQ
jgi:1,4-dihydroxy-2-naphthoate polyprenyltransferase